MPLKTIPPNTQCNNCGEAYSAHERQPKTFEYVGSRRKGKREPAKCPSRKTRFVATNRNRAYVLPRNAPAHPMRKPRNNVFWKATRPDGTSFADPSFPAYEPGYIYSAAGRGRKGKVCKPGQLHASQTPGATLVGGQFPARLFLVSGKPTSGLDEGSKWKAGFKELEVIREVPSWRIFGINGEAVVAFISKMQSTPGYQRPKNDPSPTASLKDVRFKALKILRENGYLQAYKQAVKFVKRGGGTDTEVPTDGILALMAYPWLTRAAFNTLYASTATRIPVTKGVFGARLRRTEAIFPTKTGKTDKVRVKPAA